MLCLQPDAPLEPTDAFTRLWGAESEPSYHTLLGLFASAQRFGSVAEAAEAIALPKRRLVQMSITLLQCDVLRPLLTYVHCVSEPPQPLPSSSQAEFARDVARWRLFRRLKPMLHGEHHLEEIMWQERLSREALDDLLQAYSQHLVACATFEVDVGRLGARGYQTTR